MASNATSRRHKVRVETLNYCSGGFHPVHLHETFENERYTIVHKLGHGGFATVWLARDSVRMRYVALKILAARLSKDCPEVQLLRRLREGESGDHVGKKYVMSMLDHFWIYGPNGDHLCIVSEVGGPSIELWNESPGLRSGTRRLRAAVARKISLQAAEGLAYIHAIGIVHGDFTSANILLQLANIDTWTLQEVYDRFGNPQTHDLHHENEWTADSRVPRYTVNAISMKLVDPKWLSDQIIIIDFGIAFLHGQSSLYIGTPREFCAPEFLFKSPRSTTSDTWALGCIIFEIRTGSRLFSYRGATPPRDDVLKGMVKLLGDLPSSWWDQWDTGRDWYLMEIKEGGSLESSRTGDLYYRIMEIGRLDDDALSATSNHHPSTRPGGTSEKRSRSISRSSHISTDQLIALVNQITTEEAAEVLKLADQPQTSGSNNKLSSSLASNRGSNVGSLAGKSTEKSNMSSEGISTGKGAAGGDLEAESNQTSIGKDGVGASGSAEAATSTDRIKDFLEPTGTMISELEAEGLENLLRKAMKFVPEERLTPFEIAKHHWFFDEFLVKVIERVTAPDIKEGREDEGKNR